MPKEECTRLRESVPYVKVYRYNPKHLYPKFNGYGDSGWKLLDNYDTYASVFVVLFNGFISLTSYFDVM